MKYLKFIFIIALALPVVSLAEWSAPSNGPKDVTNTPPPINVGNVNQVKSGVITANGLCVKFPLNVIRCLGTDPTTGNVFPFPWIQNGNNLESNNPSTGEVWINPAKIRENMGTSGIWSSDVPKTQALTVGGKIKAEEFCLGSECFNSWTDVRTGGSAVVSGSGTINRLSKFTATKNIGDSSMFETTSGGVSRIKSDFVFDTTGSVNASGVPTGTGGGFIIERRTTNPTNAEEGRMWLCVDEGSDCK